VPGTKGQRVANIEAEIDDRFAGKSPHTATLLPRKPVVVISFADSQRAIDFERYLKSGSGRAFANKHFR